MKPRSKVPPEQRIIRCAIKEFSRHGYAGARVDRIAVKAKFSKRMLFYYFGSKQGLFEAVLESAWRNGEIMQQSPRDASETMPFWGAFYLQNPEWTRIVGWEGLEWKKGNLLREKDRRAFWKDAVKLAEELAGPKGFRDNLEAPYVLFTMIAVEMAPVLLPNLAALILNRDTRQRDFQQEWLSFVRRLNRLLLRPAAPPKAARANDA